MKKKPWLIIAATAMVIGCVMFVGAMTMLDWDFAKLSTDNFERNTHTVKDTFTAIAVDTDTANVTLVPAKNGQVTVECFESGKLQHTVTVQDGTLRIALQDTRKWYHHIGVNFNSPKITVYLPAGEYGALSVKADTGKVNVPADFRFESMDVAVSTGDVTCAASAAGDVKIKTTTGDISMENITAASLHLAASTGHVTVKDAVLKEDVTVKVSTGKSHLTDVSCHTLYSTGSTGDITLANVIATERFTIERDTGKVTFERCDAAELLVTTSTGDVKGSLLSEKVFITTTDTGRVDVPKSVTGGRCEITTDTGDIKISVE